MILITPLPGVTTTSRLADGPFPGVEAGVVSERAPVQQGGGYLVLDARGPR